MPVLTLIRYKHNADFHPSVMGKVIAYCLQPNKTKLREEVFSVTGQNCVPSIACEQFLSTKASWGKTDGLCFRHYVQSFSPDEKISPMQANEIAREFAEKAWQDYEVLIATHVDRAHIHKLFYKGLSVYGTKPTTKSRLSRLLKELSGKRKAERKNLWNNT